MTTEINSENLRQIKKRLSLIVEQIKAFIQGNFTLGNFKSFHNVKNVIINK